MIRPGVVLGIARAEWRLTRRLVRYWVFLFFSALMTAITWGWYAFIHYSFSWASASAASANPRYLVQSFGTIFLMVFLIGIIFLGYDIRARDQRERMAEVLDARPCTNLELIIGKFVGVFVPSWIPLILIILVLQIVGMIMGWPIEPRSILGLVFVMAIPAFTFTLAATYLVTLLVKHRLVAALLLVGVLFGSYIFSNFVPLYSLPVMDVTGGFGQPFPSDLTPTITLAPALFQRAGVMLAGIGMLLLAAVFHPRRDDAPRSLHLGLGAALLVVGLGMTVLQMFQFKGLIATRANWLEAHQALRDEPVVDLQRLTGDVEVRPGKAVDMRLQMTVAAPRATSIDRALFTLNPGMEVKSISSSGQALQFEHGDNGLLSVQLSSPLMPESTQVLEFEIDGEPVDDFAYLDATVEPMNLTLPDANMLILGYDPVVFHRKYVALLPGARWMPVPGVDASPTGASKKSPDFFDVDLMVQLPDDWLAVGPGRRQATETPGRFRFAPQAPVPSVALVASSFESHSTEIQGVQMEVLLHPKHVSTLEEFAEAKEEVESWLSERLDEANQVGLGYPYGSMTLVEVPTNLRGFGGGWRMDTTLSQPGMIMMRESSFPTARFREQLDNSSRIARFDGGKPEYLRNVLETFFENDVNGGNPFVAAARSFFTYQTESYGAAAVPMDFLCETLSTKLVADKSSYFSVHFFDRNFGQRFGQAGQLMQTPDRVSDSYADVLLHLVLSRPQNWEKILEVSLADLDPWEDPARTIDVLSLKGTAMAESLLDSLGREKVGRFLAALRARTQGGAFTREDFIAAGNEVEVDLERWLQLWVEQTALPGFTIDDVQLDRLEDDEDGTPRYQALVRVRNDESVPGLLQLDYRAGDQQSGVDRGNSDPVEVPSQGSVEIGLVSQKPFSRIRVKPYLALNRDPFVVPLPGVDEERIVKQEAFTGVREAAWEPPTTTSILVDDLDDGFAILEGDSSGLRLEGKGLEQATDGGLPIYEFGQLPSKWSRNVRSTAWGKYRRTIALIKAGKGSETAVFTADLPQSGQWLLEYHVPAPTRRRKKPPKRGTWSLNLVDNSATQAISFDADNADDGWNSVGTYSMSAGEVRLEVSSQTDGRMVVADAVRWTPVDGGGAAGAQP